MRTLSQDLRERIVTSYDREEGTREQIAARHQVSLGMVKKASAATSPHRRHWSSAQVSGRKPKILGGHRQQMRKLLNKKPDLTLKALRSVMQLSCSVPAIHYALEELGLTYKKRHSAPVNRTGQT